ncbi:MULTISPECIES: hypothetical protein [unclassified Pseudomonas]|uniref:hypothetical protein n=1 Tax=unclassified Pseudomonas TaxID=196821 RepID=UPI0009248B6F|nr:MULTISPECIES: hypothetical protein [unclassified Pseudomonas]SFX01036.1 hypothetical protein SAMN03159442_00133 [Pseudomonas sp. NFACC47-1]SFX21682.1 hypothetical protein SAMN03159352_00664 [Pseudomonas sp. NFACC43]
MPLSASLKRASAKGCVLATDSKQPGDIWLAEMKSLIAAECASLFMIKLSEKRWRIA